jgi:hypothetical protein
MDVHKQKRVFALICSDVYNSYIVVISSSMPRGRSQPFSIRLGPTASLLVAEEARRTGRSRNAIVEELAEEAAKMRVFPGIAFRGVPRRAWVIGTALDVWEIVDLLRAHDGNRDELRKQNPLVGERHLTVAKTYAERFPAEIAASLDDANRPLDELLSLYPFVHTIDG